MSPAAPDSDWFARLALRCWQLVGVAAAVVVIAIAVSRLRIVVLPVILALFAASLLTGPTTWLLERGVPAALAALAVMLGAALALARVGTLVAPAVVDELDNVGTSVQGASATSSTGWPGVHSGSPSRRSTAPSIRRSPARGTSSGAPTAPCR